MMSLIILTGISGAGKSTALRRLEDAGYYCVDNLPAKLLPSFVEQCKAASPSVTQAAIGIDSREYVFRTDFQDMLSMLDELNADCKIVFLDSRPEVLQRRYIQTRRRHPMAGDGDVLMGISRERELLQPLRERAHAIIDTSDLTPFDLYARLDEQLALLPHAGMSLVFMSFGFKRGIPVDADFIFDMRFLPNPFYMEELRHLSGKDAPVREYLLQHPETARFFNQVEEMLRDVLPGFIRQGKNRVMMAFGCTGGRHRSVLAAEEISERFSNGDYSARCFHRDLLSEAKEIQERFFPKGNI